ncbi:hypothetical protein P9J64_15125 [Deltaproteobacteria bacterium IMCC39524]|nr:hypothetical protein [Deltaproteobacteria bacterium IMCC39524]
MKLTTIAVTLLALMMIGCGPKETEQYLSCEAIFVSPIRSSGTGSKSNFGFTITKLDDKVIKVKSNFGRVYTEEETIHQEEGKNIALKLIVEDTRIKMHALFEGEERPIETIIDNSGGLNRSSYGGWFEGSCKVSAKVF